MFKRLRILTMLQLSDRLNLKKYKDSTKLATTITIVCVKNKKKRKKPRIILPKVKF